LLMLRWFWPTGDDVPNPTATVQPLKDIVSDTITLHERAATMAARRAIWAGASGSDHRPRTTTACVAPACRSGGGGRSRDGARRPSVARPPPRRWAILRFALIGQLIIAANVGTVNVALPSIRTELDASAADIQWVIVLYQLSYAIMLISGGRLGDIFWSPAPVPPRHHHLRARLGHGGSGGRTSAYWPAPRLQGIGGGLRSPQILALVQVIFPLHERSRAILTVRR